MIYSGGTKTEYCLVLNEPYLEEFAKHGPTKCMVFSGLYFKEGYFDKVEKELFFDKENCKYIDFFIT